MSRSSRTGSLGEVLPIALVEPDGLLVTTDGRYVRVIECDRVPNTITADPTALAQIEAAFAHLCRLIPDRQSLVIYAQTDPVPIDEALAADRHATAISAEQAKGFTLYAIRTILAGRADELLDLISTNVARRILD